MQYESTECDFLLLSEPRDGACVAFSCVSAVCEDVVWKPSVGWAAPDVFAEAAAGNTLSDSGDWSSRKHWAVVYTIVNLVVFLFETNFWIFCQFSVLVECVTTPKKIDFFIMYSCWSSYLCNSMEPKGLMFDCLNDRHVIPCYVVFLFHDLVKAMYLLLS